MSVMQCICGIRGWRGYKGSESHMGDMSWELVQSIEDVRCGCGHEMALEIMTME
jgi:hypothetical protein